MTTYRRRNRILCLHGPTQSAASFRAGLKPICDRMESNWEFHFLDAPYIVPDQDDHEGDQRESNQWSQAAILSSKLAAIDSELEHRPNCETLRTERQRVWQELSATAEGKEVWETQETSGVDGVESLISTKVAKSMSRDWAVCITDDLVGVDVGLSLIGDYMRENGNFHGIIGFDSGSTMALLVQALLSHPRSSSTAFPTYFARLPQGVTRMPRMGGWEEEPPAPDDPRLGSENLAKDYVPAQKPFEVVIAIHPSRTALGERAGRWLDEKKPILHTASPEAFSNHSLGVVSSGPLEPPSTQAFEHQLEYGADAFVFDKQHTNSLAEFLILAIASCQGDHKARSRLTESRRNSSGKAQTAKL